MSDKVKNKDEFVAEVKKCGLSLNKFVDLLDDWFDLTTDERKNLRLETPKYKKLKGEI